MAKNKNKTDNKAEDVKKVEEAPKLETPKVESKPTAKPKEEKGAVVETSRHGVAVFQSGRHPRDIRKANEPEVVTPQPKDGVQGTQ